MRDAVLADQVVVVVVVVVEHSALHRADRTRLLVEGR